MNYLSNEELKSIEPAENAGASPVPTQIVSNGEFTPLPQTAEQRRVEARIAALAAELAPQARHGPAGLPRFERAAWPRLSLR